MKPLLIKIIIGSIRNGRFGDKPAAWILEQSKSIEGVVFEILDLRDHPLPMFAEAASPAYVQGPYATPEANRLAVEISKADGFIVVTPEYNHGYPSSLKNAMDYLYKEWNKKPIAFVGYGSAGGARAVEQLRQVAVELQMAPTRTGVHIMFPWNLVEKDGSLKNGALDAYEASAKTMLEQLVWWSRALQTARTTSK